MRKEVGQKGKGVAIAIFVSDREAFSMVTEMSSPAMPQTKRCKTTRFGAA